MSREDAAPICPLCHAAEATSFFEDTRDYNRCPTCRFVFVPPRFFLSPDEEREVYDQHENSPDDPGYRKFLSRLFEPMNARLPPGSHGLDFGSGPGPTLSVMFKEAGHTTAIYDPFYAPDAAPLTAQYDFITASEVVEHLHRPGEELSRLWSLLKPGGLLGIMTKRVIDQAAFSRWHYKNDPTHVAFFSTETFAWLADQWNAKLDICGDDVVLLEKP